MRQSAKFYNPFHVFLLSILFSPLAGMFMIGRDYKQLGRRNWLVYAILPLIIVVAASFVDLIIFEENIIPQFIFTSLLSFTYYLYSRKIGEENPQAGLRTGWDSFKVGLAAFLVTLPLALIFFEG